VIYRAPKYERTESGRIETVLGSRISGDWKKCEKCHCDYHPLSEGCIVFSSVCLWLCPDVCLFICLHDSSWTVRYIITTFSGNHSRKGGQVRKWLNGILHYRRNRGKSASWSLGMDALLSDEWALTVYMYKN